MENKLLDQNFKNRILSVCYKLYKLQYNNSNNKFDNSDAIKQNKKENTGEVLTPLPLVYDMLTKLPFYIWRKKDFKWLDPVSGDGHFMLVIYFILIELLPDSEFKFDHKMKSRHIIKNMLYMNDINPDNCERTRNIFKLIDPLSMINILNKDFLKSSLYDHTNCYFDIIVMNPPYNLDGIKSKGQKNVWVYFTEIAFKILKKSGYLVTIHPSSWRINNYQPWGTKVNIHDIYLSKNILYISMYTIWQTYQLMGVQINIDYLIIHNESTKIETLDSSKNITQQIVEIENIYGEKYNINLRNNIVIGNFGHLIINKLLSLCEKYGSLHSLLYHTSELHHDLWKKKKIKEGPHPIIHLMKKKGKTIYMSEKPHTHQTTPKIIINGFGVKYIYFDKKGEYGTTDTPFILLTDNQNIYNMLSTNLWNFIVNSLGILGNNLNERVFFYIPNIQNIITDQKRKGPHLLQESEIFNLLNLSENEKTQIIEMNNNNIQNIKMKDRKDNIEDNSI